MRPVRIIAARVTAAQLAVLAAALLVGGCSGQGGPIDDGSYSVIDAGAPAALKAAGVELVATTARPGLVLDDVTDALVAAGLPAESGTREDRVGLGFDPAATAALLGTAGNLSLATGGEEHYVVLVFADPAAAIVFAEGTPRIFADPSAEEVRRSYVAGNLVGYYAPSNRVDETDAFSGVLEDLCAPAPGATPTS